MLGFDLTNKEEQNSPLMKQFPGWQRKGGAEPLRRLQPVGEDPAMVAEHAAVINRAGLSHAVEPDQPGPRHVVLDQALLALLRPHSQSCTNSYPI